MPIEENAIPLIARLESEIWNKCRELARAELEGQLQQEANQQGRFSPLDRNPSGQMPVEGPDNLHTCGGISGSHGP